MDSDENLVLWEKLETLAESSLEMFSHEDVEQAMKTSNFN